MTIDDDTRAWLEKHYMHTLNKDIMMKFGWSANHLKYVATKLSLKKSRQFKRKTAQKCLSLRLTDEQTEWLKNNFANTKNDILCKKLNVSNVTLHRFARRMKLKKDAAFIKKCQAEMTEAARVAHIISGWPPKGYVIPNCYRFKKGVSNVERLGVEGERERQRKAAESRRKTIAMERARITFGLPQKTKMKLVSESKTKRNMRWYLKRHGYMLDEEESVAYYDEMTVRAMTMERRGNKFYEFASISELRKKYHEEFKAAREKYLNSKNKGLWE